MSFIENIKESMFNLSNDAKFKHLTAAKVAFVPFISLIVISFGFWIFLETMYGFFMASNLSKEVVLKDVFYTKILSDIVHYLPLLALYFIMLYAIGFYLASLLLRSFKKIGTFSERLIEDNNVEFKISTLEKRKYLMRFAKLFFEYMADCRAAGQILKTEVPMKFWNIRGVIFDYIHYFIYVLLLFIITIITTIGLDSMSKDIYQNLTSFAIEVLDIGQTHMNFFHTQQELLGSIVVVSTIMMILVYLLIANSLFARVNGVTYAYFRTLKEVLAGNWEEKIVLRYGDPGGNDSESVNNLIDIIEEEIDEIEVFEEEATVEDAPNVQDTPETPPNPIVDTVKEAEITKGTEPPAADAPPPLPANPLKK